MGLALFWGASFALAVDEDCVRQSSPLQQGQELGDLSCAVECEAYYLTNPSAKPVPGEPPACQKNAVSYAYQMASPAACMNGAWDGVLSLPETLKAYGLLVENIGDYIHENIKEHQSFLARCDREPACRREAARSLTQYSEKDENGRWLVPDSVVDEEAQATDIVSLLTKVKVHKASFQKYCETVLYGISSDLRSQNLESYDFANERFNRLAAKEPKCVGAMKLTLPSRDQFKERGSGDWLRQLGIKLQCHSPKKMTELICYEIAALVIDPVNLVGGGLALKAMTKAGLAAKSIKSTAKVLGERQGENGVLKLSSPYPERFHFAQTNITEPAHFYTFKIGKESTSKEIQVIVPAIHGRVDARSAEEIRKVLSTMPESVLQDLDRVTVNTNYSAAEKYWAKKYGKSDFKVAATGGSDSHGTTVDFYPWGMSGMIKSSERAEIMAHELGHVVAARRFGSTAPPESYLKAKTKDGTKVSAYGETNLTEDYAEAMAVYIRTEGGVHDQAALKKFANRFEFIDDVLKLDPNAKREVFKAYQDRMRAIHGTTISRVGASTVLAESGRILIVNDQNGAD